MEINQQHNVPDTNEINIGKARALQQSVNGKSTTATAQNQQFKKVSQDFEALFVGMMLKSMRDTVPKDKVTGGGHGEEIYRSLLDQEYAAQSVKRGGLGLAKQIEKDLVRQESRRVMRNVNTTE